MNDAEFRLLDEIEEGHWWFVGKRLILRRLRGVFSEKSAHEWPVVDESLMRRLRLLCTIGVLQCDTQEVQSRK